MAGAPPPTGYAPVSPVAAADQTVPADNSVPPLPAVAPISPAMNSAMGASQPSSMGAPTEPIQDVLAPGTNATPGQNIPFAPIQAAPEVRLPQRSDAAYQPVVPHGWRKALALAGVGMAAFNSPEAGARISHDLFDAPREQAEARFETDTANAQKQREEQRQQANETSEAEHQRAQDVELAAKAKKDADIAKQARFQHVVIEDPEKPGEPKAVNFNLTTGAYTDPITGDAIAGAKPWVKPAAEPKENKAVAGTVNGKPAWGVQTDKGWVDPQTQNPIPKFAPAPNYAEIIPQITAQRQRTQTKTMFGPDGKPHEFSYNTQNGMYDIDQGFSTAGAAGGREAQANVVAVAGRNLIEDIKTHKDDLGTLTAWYKQHTLNVPYAGDPELAEIDSELRSFAALNPAMHGFRSTNALDTFEKIIGGLSKNPDAIIGSIRGILKTAGTLGTVGGQAAQGGANNPTPQTHIFSRSAYQKANPKGDVKKAEADAKAAKYTVVD